MSICWMLSEIQFTIIFCLPEYHNSHRLDSCQVQVIFHLPQEYGTFTHPLAYVKWFTAFSTPTANLGMYQISHSSCSHHRQASIIPITQIKCSVHLILKFGKQMDVSWSADDVLERCKYFYVNCYLQHLDFLLFQLLMGIQLLFP